MLINPQSAPNTEPQLLRFRLRQLFFGITVVSVLCGLLVLTSGPWPMVIVVTTSLVAAHVLGNLIGTRLRDTSHAVRRWRASDPRFESDQPRANITPVEIAHLNLPPATPLADHGRVIHWRIWFVAGGALLGALAGGVLIALTVGTQIGWPGWLVGTLSCTVLGTWAAFLVSSFSSIARHAWRDAHGRKA